MGRRRCLCRLLPIRGHAAAYKLYSNILSHYPCISNQPRIFQSIGRGGRNRVAPHPAACLPRVCTGRWERQRATDRKLCRSRRNSARSSESRHITGSDHRGSSASVAPVAAWRRVCCDSEPRAGLQRSGSRVRSCTAAACCKATAPAIRAMHASLYLGACAADLLQHFARRRNRPHHEKRPILRLACRRLFGSAEARQR
jgi:hypothetical protein